MNMFFKSNEQRMIEAARRLYNATHGAPPAMLTGVATILRLAAQDSTGDRKDYLDSCAYQVEDCLQTVTTIAMMYGSKGLKID